MKSNVENKIKGERSEIQVVLRRIAPNNNIDKIYKDENLFLDGLVDFVREGLKAGDSIVIIATTQHLTELDSKLRAEAFDIFYLTLRGQYIPFDADVLLEKFMVQGWPDEVLFRHLVMSLAARALKNDAHVRAFSEMAGILWLRGNRSAAVQLEHNWNKLIQTNTEYDNVRLKIETIPPFQEDSSLPEESSS